MVEDLKWIVGIGIAIATFFGGYISRDRHVMTKIQTGDDRLHKRITDLEKDVVRKADFERHTDRVDRSIEGVREEIREGRQETTARLDTILTAVNSSKN